MAVEDGTLALDMTDPGSWLPHICCVTIFPCRRVISIDSAMQYFVLQKLLCPDKAGIKKKKNGH